MSRVIVNQTMTADCYAAGPNQTEERPFGDDGGDGWGNRLHAWMFDQADENQAEIDQMRGAAAHIMGRNMFGPVRGDWDRDWQGCWGDDPPFHAGARLFDGVPPLDLEQVHARTASTVLHVTYRVEHPAHTRRTCDRHLHLGRLLHPRRLRLVQRRR